MVEITELDVLPSVLPDDGLAVTRLSEVAARAVTETRLDVAGVRGCADALVIGALARNAVHAAMAGKTDILVGRWHRCFTHVPLERVLEHEKRIDPAGVLWREVVEATGQPSFWVA